MLAFSDAQTTALITGGFGVLVAVITGGFLVLSRKLDTGNGRKLGQTVHDIEDAVHDIKAQAEFALAQGHTNAKEIVALHEKVDRIEGCLETR